MFGIGLLIVLSLGNHEFDNGVSGLTPFIEQLSCPVLAANLVLTKVPELAREANLKKSIILNVAGRNIGIIGYLTPETKTLAVPNDVDYIDEIVALKQEVNKLKNQSNIIIALGHSGYTKDLEIAREVEGLDLVIGGHTNTFLWNGTTPDLEHSHGPYPTYVTQATGKSVPVVQAYAYTKYLGKLHLAFNSNGESLSANGNPILLDNSIPQDPEIVKIVDQYKSAVQNMTERVIGNTSVLLDGHSCQIHECNLGNLITDAVVHYYAINYRGEHWTDAPIAIIQGGGIRSSISHATMPTTISKGDLLAVLPFEGNVVTVTMNGSVVLQMLEHSIAKYDPLDDPGEFLQFSGLKVVYNLRKPPQSRVVKAEARCWTCNIPSYSKIEEKDVYKILMSNFLYNGGDGYSMFKDLPSQALDYSELSCTEYYIQRRSPVFPQEEGRTTLLGGEPLKDSSSISSLSLASALISIVCLIIIA